MNDPKFKEGDWVKDKNGTQGMTVVGYADGDTASGGPGEVRCRYKTETGEEKEESFPEEDLVQI